MLRALQRQQPWAQRSIHRLYSTSPPKTTVQMVSELRKLTNAPIIKARQALTETNNDFDAALKWLEKELLVAGAAKAEKIKDRVASEGLISVSILNAGVGQADGAVKAAIVELNCESDFVSRTDEFARLASEIAQTVAWSAPDSTKEPFSTVDVASLLESQLVTSQKTVHNSVVDLVARLGENISLRRAAYLSARPRPDIGLRVASYTHNALPNFSSQGRMGTLALLSLQSPRLSEVFKNEAQLSELAKFERALCRQIAGFNPLSVREPASTDATEDTVLYKQPFGMYGGEKASLPVRQVMDEWQAEQGLDGVEVMDFIRWEVGETH